MDFFFIFFQHIRTSSNKQCSSKRILYVQSDICMQSNIFDSVTHTYTKKENDQQRRNETSKLMPVVTHHVNLFKRGIYPNSSAIKLQNMYTHICVYIHTYTYVHNIIFTICDLVYLSPGALN